MVNLRTLAYANEAVLAANVAALYLCAAWKRPQPGIRWFAHSIGLAMVGEGLQYVGAGSPVVALLLGHTLCLLAIMVLRWGLEELTGPPRRAWRLDAAVVAAQAVGLSLFLAPADPSACYVIASLALAVETGWALRPLLQAAELQWSARRAALVALATFAVFDVLRALATLQARAGALNANRVETVALTVEMMFNSLFALGSVWLASSAQQERLSEQTRRDGLTGLLNYRGLRAVLAATAANARCRRHALAMIAVDLDHFKKINDGYGHPAGDAALAAVARILSTEARTGDAVARTGGEEFALLLPGLDTPQAAAKAMAVAERLRHGIVQSGFAFEGTPIPLTASFGIALVRPDDSHEPDFAGLLRRADRALYAAKQAGRNRTVLDSATRPAVHAQAAAE
jgi:diguanylate cyclase (GGDEF)-like protein